jgi:hypothetical protein
MPTRPPFLTERGLHLNLAVLRDRPLRLLQEITDVLQLAGAGALQLNARTYLAHAEILNVPVAENARVPFDELGPHHERWCTLHCLRDAVDIVSSFLEDVRFSCASIKAASAGTTFGADSRTLRAESRAFQSEGLPRRIQVLQETYGIRSDFGPHVISMNAARNCLVHRLGVVSMADVKNNPDGVLQLQWASISVVVTDPAGVKSCLLLPQQLAPQYTKETVIESLDRVFTLGETLTLTYRDMIGLMYSTSQFMKDLSCGVMEYSRRLRVPIHEESWSAIPSGARRPETSGEMTQDWDRSDATSAQREAPKSPRQQEERG